MRQLLSLHPDSPSFAAANIEVEVARPHADHLLLSYTVTGKMDDIRMPPVMTATRGDELWRHTCFEAFVRASSGAGYYEFNLAPSTQWAAYRFTSHRSGMCVAPEITAIPIESAIEPRPLHIAGLAGAGSLVGFAVQHLWRLGLSALIEDTSGRKSYWALAHPPGKPDFHHPDCFSHEFSPALNHEFGIDRLIAEPALRAPLEGKRVALLAHPASVTEDLTHSLDALAACGDVKISAAFGPQHGLRGDKQDNMIESPDFSDPVHGIPVFSLYGEVRRPTNAMMDAFDVILVDLQDLGCRIYTFITTLRYVLEAAAQHRKAVWVLDRPNPVGRPVEGLTLRAGWESFVGAGPLPMRHGLTLGELGLWFVKTLKLDVEYRVIEMQGWQPDAAPGFGWPLGERTWINPSPNAPNLWMARAYAGTVMLEGTTLSEGRGTTRPLELFGAPDIDARAVMTEMHSLAPQWLDGCRLRECWFEPTFHKHAGKLCHGVQIHTEGPGYDHQAFKPWRIQALAFKAIRRLYPDYPLWRDFPTSTSSGRLAIDVINGSPLLREWVDDPSATPHDLDALARADEQAWSSQRQDHVRY